MLCDNGLKCVLYMELVYQLQAQHWYNIYGCSQDCPRASSYRRATTVFKYTTVCVRQCHVVAHTWLNDVAVFHISGQLVDISTIACPRSSRLWVYGMHDYSYWLSFLQGVVTVLWALSTWHLNCYAVSGMKYHYTWPNEWRNVYWSVFHLPCP